MKRRTRHIALSAAAAVVLTAALAGCDSNHPEHYPLTVHLSAMDPHVGQLFELRVWNVDNGREIDYVRIEELTSTAFTITSPGLVPGRTYNVDWYADLNMNGRYDAPPVDHAWRRTVGPVMGPEAIDFVHDTVWVDVEWPD